jgi:hypothetical protein
MAAGYLQTLSQNYSQAGIFFDLAEKQLPTDPQIKDQLRLLRFINKLSEIDKMDNSAENKILADLDWIYNKLPKSNPSTFRYSKAISWSKTYISSLYKYQKNVLFAHLFHPNNEFYHENANVESLKIFLEKDYKTPYEKLVQSICPVSTGDIYEYQAIINTFDNKIDQALAYMQKADGCKETELKANPFNGFIKDCHDCEHNAPQKTKFSKLRFIEILQIMQTKIRNGEDLYNNYLLLGNSFYNITYYGNARVFYEGNIIGNGMNTPWYFDDYYDKIIFGMRFAKYYYQKAFEVATNNEQKAKCSYMLAKCERNEYYNDNNMTGNDWGNNTHADFLAWDGFKKLKNQYSNTKYYKDVISECGYFASYAGN